MDDAGVELLAGPGYEAAVVELFGDAGLGVIIEKPVDLGEDVARCAPGLVGGQPGVDLDAGGLAGPEAHVRRDAAVGAGQRDVGDEQADHALAFALRGSGVGPQGREVGGQGGDAGLAGAVERDGPRALALVVLLGGGECAQRLVPVGFEVGGDQAVVWVDGEVAATCGFGGVPCALDALAAQMVGFGGAVLELCLHRQGGVKGERGDGGEQQLADGSVDLASAYARAGRPGIFYAGALADVLGHCGPSPGVVTDCHPVAAPPAEHDSLQQRRALPWRAGPPVLATGLRALGEAGPVFLLLPPGYLAGLGPGGSRGPRTAG